MDSDQTLVKSNMTKIDELIEILQYYQQEFMKPQIQQDSINQDDQKQNDNIKMFEFIMFSIESLMSEICQKMNVNYTKFNKDIIRINTEQKIGLLKKKEKQEQLDQIMASQKKLRKIIDNVD